MITSATNPTLVGALDTDATPVEDVPRAHDGRMPLDVLPNWYAEHGYIPDAPRPNRTPVEGQEILR